MSSVTVKATDLRERSEPFTQIEVTYDPDDIEEFDTREDSYSMWEAAWGQRVEVPEGMLYLVCHSYGEGVTKTTRNALKDD